MVMRKEMYPVVLVLMWSVLFSREALGQGSAGTDGGAEPRFLVDAPTAGMLGSGTLAFDIDFFQNGGLLVAMNYGILSRFSLGISYGGSNLIGDGTAQFNPVPGFNAKVRPFEEGVSFPAIVLGFDSQGREEHIDSLDRYTIQSKGLYIAASKNFTMAGFFSIHGGANYSLEGPQDDREVAFFVGAEKTIGSAISAVLEYNSGGGKISKGRGYLNLGLRWSPGGGFTIGFDLKDLVRNDEKVTIGNRSVKIEFLKPL
jgi:hypothetical protein